MGKKCLQYVHYIALIYICFTIFVSYKLSISNYNQFNMKSISKGNIVKFHTPLPDENLDQLYVVLEVIEDDERPRADIQALNTGLSFPPISKVRLGDLLIVTLCPIKSFVSTSTISKSPKRTLLIGGKDNPVFSACISALGLSSSAITSKTAN